MFRCWAKISSALAHGIDGAAKSQRFTARHVHIIYVEDHRLAFDIGDQPQAVPTFPELAYSGGTLPCGHTAIEVQMTPDTHQWSRWRPLLAYIHVILFG